MSVVAETVLTYLPPKRKTTPSGWTRPNAPVVIITVIQQTKDNVVDLYQIQMEV